MRLIFVSAAGKKKKLCFKVDARKTEKKMQQTLGGNVTWIS